MNATNQPIDVLLNAKSAQLPSGGARDFGLSHSNTKENSFDRVLNDQRRADSESGRDALDERRERPVRAETNHKAERPETPVRERRETAEEVNSSNTEVAAAEDQKGSESGNELPEDGKKTNASVDIAAEVNVEDEKLIIDISLSQITDEAEEVEDEPEVSVVSSDLEAELEQSLQVLQNTVATQQNSGLGQEKIVQSVSIPALVNQLKQAAVNGEVDSKLEANLKNLTGQLSGKIELGDGNDKGLKLDALSEGKGFSLGQELKALLRNIDASANNPASNSAGLKVGSSTGVENRNPAINSLLQSLQTPGLAGASKAGLTTSTIQVPVSSPNWSQAVAQRIAWLAGNGVQAAQLNLNPQDLGPVEVRISVTNDQTNINFSSQHGAVRDALAQSVDLLRDMLEANGLSLADVDVSDQSLAEQQSESEGTGDGADIASNSDSESENDTVAQQQIISSSLVDYYA